MFSRQVASVMAAGLFASCLFAQGLQTKATKDDWEEINFEFNSAILSDGYPTLLRIAELLQQHRDYKIKVEGHTDYVGSVPYNEKLALARGNEVRAFLTKYGVGANQVSVSGQGKRVPEVPNTTKEGRFINRRVVLTVTDANGNIIAAGSGPEVVNTLDDRLKKLEDCCNQILKKLDKLDDILAAIRDLKAENDRLKSDVAALKNRPEPTPPQPPPPPPPVVAAAPAPEHKKYTTVAANVGPTMYGGLTFTGSGRFFAPFGESNAVQAQGEYMYHGGGASRVEGRQEGQFDLGLIHRFDNIQVGLFSSFKYLNIAEFQTGGALGQGALTFDYVFKRGRIGAFGTKGFINTADLNHATLGPSSYIETYAQIVDQVGGSALLGLWGDAYAEGNIGYLRLHGGTASNGIGTGKPGGMIRLVQPLSAHVAATLEAGLNETLITSNNSGRVVFGLQFGNWLRPKEYGDVKHPVPVDVPRVRYQLLTRQVGHSPPIADAGPSQIGVPPGTITLNGSASYSPDGLPLTYQWTQIFGPTVAITGANSAIATFTAAASQSYGFRLTVKDPYGLMSSANTTVTTTRTPGIQIVEFSASPETIPSGGSSQLFWNVRGATNISISGGVGTVLPQGVKTVTPAATTTYTLTATAPGLPTATASVTVTVRPPTPGDPRIIRYSAVPTNIVQGESSTLSWTTEGAATVTITGVSGTLPLSGSTVVTPTQTTTYTLTATASDGRSVSAPVIVTVGNVGVARIISFSANPTTIDVGGSSQLCWNVENSTSVTITPGVGPVSAVACATVSPVATTTYTLTAHNTQGDVTASTTITVGGSVRILSFTSNPEYSSAAGSPVVLSWTTTGAVSVSIITGNPTGGANLQNLPPSGTVTVNPNTNTDYTLTAYGPGGTAVSVVIQVFVR
jgi:hypothetical protein